MSEPVVEVVPETAIAVVPKVDELESLVKESDKGMYRATSGIESLNWKDLKPHQMALLLTQKPITAGGGTTYLSMKQALYFAVRCYELGVSPFSPAVWFDPNRFSVNLTLEGKREVARNRGIDLGPPMFESLKREWKDLPKMTEGAEIVRKEGYAFDVGVKCRIRVGDPKYNEHAEYTAWLSEWYQPKSPLWKGKMDHMLQTRATEKAISMALGTGASSMPDEKELE